MHPIHVLAPTHLLALYRNGLATGAITVLAFCAVIIGVMWLIGLPGRRRSARLHNSTLFGEAYVRSVTAENVRSRGPRYVRYDVTITAEGRAPYEAHTSVLTTVTDMPALNVGRTFPIQIDPADPSHFRFVRK